MSDGSSPACVLFGRDEFDVVDAVETDDGVMQVEVRIARPEAPCLDCGTFTSRVNQYRTQRVKDGLSFERPTVLVWRKRRFRCDTPGCRKSFTKSTDQVPARKRLTKRLREAIGKAAVDRFTAPAAGLVRGGVVDSLAGRHCCG